jgi:hypothetical protein
MFPVADQVFVLGVKRAARLFIIPVPLNVVPPIARTLSCPSSRGITVVVEPFFAGYDTRLVIVLVAVLKV